MIERLFRLCYKSVAFASRLQISDAVLYAKAYWSVRIGDSGKREVGESEIYTTLTYARSIEVALFNHYFRTCESLTHLSELYAVFTGKLITIVEDVFQ